MSNLKIGDTVMHGGVKRRVSHIVPIFGQHLLILGGFPYMVRSRDVKPVIRVSAILHPWGGGPSNEIRYRSGVL